ncbi:glycogen/starch/alpha-glucan phosphorylase [Myxococcota bacterium]|nr:glycogen/starch/alpha-glucan phosphorylase [Myxococcota bacterium]
MIHQLSPDLARFATGRGLDAESIRRDFVDKLFHIQAKFPGVALTNDLYLALALAVRDRLMERWVRSAQTFLETASRTVAYLSAEYLIGPQLGSNLVNLGIMEPAREAMAGLGIDLDRLIEHEVEPGLGNGGLGRLAACFMDSLATLEYPAIGYGIRYEFGIFDQVIRDGAQHERADKWLRAGYPWELQRHLIEYSVKLGGHTEHYVDDAGRYRVRWVAGRVLKGVPFDTPILGFGTDNCNFLRLWQATADETFDFQAFNLGEYYKAVQDKMESENVTKALYPNDQGIAGKRLRLEQQYFFVSCSLQDMIRLYMQKMPTLDNFHEKFAVQLNDTHPALAVPELMRILVDQYELSWEKAWFITQRTFGYTNHTLLPEALETWPLGLMQSVLPRIVEIIFEINRRFLEDASERFPSDPGKVSRLSIIDDHGEKRVRMANLATIGSHTVNGVAELHSQLLRDTVLHDFAELWPAKFKNVTNGVTPRRFVVLSNPRLTKLVSDAIGTGWIRDLSELKKLEPLAEDAAFREAWRKVKLDNKRALGAHLATRDGLSLDPNRLLDVQVKRMHEYKRQLLNALHVIARYAQIRRGRTDFPPRTFLFGGKAAPGYWMAKLIIRFIHAIGETIARDPVAKKYLEVVFVPNFNVKVAQHIYPAADLSEQISTAGKEASGTGNMKLSMNGALTIGTLDGANVEIREEVGADSFFLFGLTTDEVRATKASGYRPRDWLEKDSELAEVIDLIASGHFSYGDRGLFRPIVDSLVERDEYLLFADFRTYVDAHDRVSAVWVDPDRWARMSILNAARTGKFSSDRSIEDYAREIWQMKRVSIPRTP